MDQGILTSGGLSREIDITNVVFLSIII